MTNVTVTYIHNGKKCKLEATIKQDKNGMYELTNHKKNDKVIFSCGLTHMYLGTSKDGMRLQFDIALGTNKIINAYYGSICNPTDNNYKPIADAEVSVVEVKRATRKFDIVTSIEQMLAAHDLPECRDVTLNQDGTVTIYIDGDWKHSHIYCDYLMNQRGWACIENRITNEDGTDWYASEHTYRRNH